MHPALRQQALMVVLIPLICEMKHPKKKKHVIDIPLLPLLFCRFAQHAQLLNFVGVWRFPPMCFSSPCHAIFCNSTASCSEKDPLLLRLFNTCPFCRIISCYGKQLHGRNRLESTIVRRTSF